uniref:Dienoyl coA isomerase n=1 Tax=Gambierdiscus pacificus TaxID=439314 RepID=A0A6M5KEJ4_9DINO|nr:dienoyl coA isomerase [Gambierdiscus pacificus]
MQYGPYETLRVTKEDGILHVELNRPQKLNAMNRRFWQETRECFSAAAEDTEARAIVISAQGRAFSSGLDLSDMAPPASEEPASGKPKRDAGRLAYRIRREVLHTQESFNAIEACPQPVIVVGHGAVVGGGIDLMCTCCIRYASRDAWFTIKEVDIGLAADVGTLQRLPKIIGNEGAVRELAYTARKFTAEEALALGFLTRLFDTRDQALAAAMSLAKEIAQKPPLAVVGTKRMLDFTRNHSVQDGLEYVATWNGAMMQSPDLATAAAASLLKKTVSFSKL